MNQQNNEFIFISKRLGYRLIKETDFDNYIKLDSSPEVREFFPSGAIDAKQVKENIKKNIC